jgi:hypothetical protein
MWSNRYWAKTYWAGNYWTPNTTTTQDVELLGGGGYVYIPAHQKKHKVHIDTIVTQIITKQIPKKKIKQDLKQLSALFNVSIKKPQDISKIDRPSLLKETKALEILLKIYLNFVIKEEDELLVLLLLLDMI